MAHSNPALATDKVISSIKLPDGNVYEIHDPSAIHDISELNLASVLKFKGVVASYDELASKTDTAEDGDVWHVASGEAAGLEYVWSSTLNRWEALGKIYDSASSEHTHTVTVSGTNKASSVSANGYVTVPTISATHKYLYADQGAPTVTPTTDKVLGANTAFTVTGGTASTTKIKATASGVAVSGDGTVQAVTGYDENELATAISALSTKTINVPSNNGSVSVPNITGNEDVSATKIKTYSAGTSATFTPTVTNGVLDFNFVTNTPTTLTKEDVTATKTVLGNASSVPKIEIGTEKVAIGSAGSVSFLTPASLTKDAVLTGVKVTAQPTVTLSSGTTGDVSVATGVSAISVSASGEEVDALTAVSVSNPRITLAYSNTEADGSQKIVSNVTVGNYDATVSVSGTAAAQEWSGTTTVSKPK